MGGFPLKNDAYQGDHGEIMGIFHLIGCYRLMISWHRLMNLVGFTGWGMSNGDLTNQHEERRFERWRYFTAIPGLYESGLKQEFYWSQLQI